MNDVLRRSAAHVFVESLNNPQLDDLDAHHLLKVLRVRDTDSISLSDGLGGWMTATLSKEESELLHQYAKKRGEHVAEEGSKLKSKIKSAFL